jgi:hypothetical protein
VDGNNSYKCLITFISTVEYLSQTWKKEHLMMLYVIFEISCDMLKTKRDMYQLVEGDWFSTGKIKGL